MSSRGCYAFRRGSYCGNNTAPVKILLEIQVLCVNRDTVAHLPYNRRLLHFLQGEHSRGRSIYLATGADARLAHRVADHLGIFTSVPGGDGTHNLTGNPNLDRLQNLFGLGEFA